MEILYFYGAKPLRYSHLFEKTADPIKKAFGRKKLAPNESRSENVSPQMEANHFFNSPQVSPNFHDDSALKKGQTRLSYKLQPIQHFVLKSQILLRILCGRGIHTTL